MDDLGAFQTFGSISALDNGNWFRLLPTISNELEAMHVCRFLSCLEASPQRTDTLRKALEESREKILEITSGFLRISRTIPALLAAAVVRVFVFRRCILES